MYIRILVLKLEPMRRPDGTKRATKKTLVLNSNPEEATLDRFGTKAKNLERRIGSSLDIEIQMHNNIHIFCVINKLILINVNIIL